MGRDPLTRAKPLSMRLHAKGWSISDVAVARDAWMPVQDASLREKPFSVSSGRRPREKPLRNYSASPPGITGYPPPGKSPSGVTQPRARDGRAAATYKQRRRLPLLKGTGMRDWNGDGVLRTAAAEARRAFAEMKAAAARAGRVVREGGEEDCWHGMRWNGGEGEFRSHP